MGFLVSLNFSVISFNFSTQRGLSLHFVSIDKQLCHCQVWGASSFGYRNVMVARVKISDGCRMKHLIIEMYIVIGVSVFFHQIKQINSWFRTPML